VEYSHPAALKQFNNNDWVPQTMVSRVHEEPEGLKVLLQYPFMYRDIQVNYLTTNLPVASFTSERRHFLGANGYGTWADPQALQAPELDDFETRRGQTVGALLHHLGTLQPGETRRLIVQLGQAASLDAALPDIRRYRDPAEVAAAREELDAFWAAYLDKMQVETPDAAMNAMLNVHNPRQCYVTLNWSRYLSRYQVGLGARGIGFRDSSQDVMGAVLGAPAHAWAMLEKLLQVQRRDGSAMHQFYPLTMEARVGDAAEMEDRLHYYGDDHLWGVLAVAAYVKETGDLDVLDQVLPFYEKDKDGRPLEEGTVLEHLRRALAFTREHVGAHGLPLLGFADWNDTVNLRPGAESLFNANLYGTALREMAALMAYQGDEADAATYRAWYDEMRERVNAHAWDGDWYVRYFDHDGTPIGSHTNEKGQIYLNAQSWPVVSGFAPPERARQALDAAFARLNTRHGLKVSTPGYNGFDPDKGGITTYPPGAKENGGIFLHTNPWMMIAEARMGRGDRAHQYYSQINPAARNDQMEVFESEPYAYPQNILSDEHPQFGLGRNSWLTGTASWTYQAGTQYILGVRPTFAGLRIDPCIPADWEAFSVRRVFRGATYEIEVRNPEGVCRGVREITVDGEPLAGDVLPVFGDGQVHRVEVVLGGG
jgi:cellobiose phosphorylase